MIARTDEQLAPPAIVRPAASDRAALIRAAIKSGTEKRQSGLLDWHQAGVELTRQKAECKHGEWLPWLRANGIKERQAQRLIELAKYDAASDLEDAWRRINGHTDAAKTDAASVLPGSVEPPPAAVPVRRADGSDDVPPEERGDAWEPPDAEARLAGFGPATAAAAETNGHAPEPAAPNFCQRCQRVGPVRGCQACAELRSVSKGAKKDKADANGAAKVSFAEIDAAFGKLRRTIDRVSLASGVESAAYRAAVAALSAFFRAVEAWRKERGSGETAA